MYGSTTRTMDRMARTAVFLNGREASIDGGLIGGMIGLVAVVGGGFVS